MNPHTVVAWLGAGVIYAVFVWAMIVIYRDVANPHAPHSRHVRALLVPGLYFVTIALSIVQEGFAYQLISS